MSRLPSTSSLGKKMEQTFIDALYKYDYYTLSLQGSY
jgi:hypothetical protein